MGIGTSGLPKWRKREGEHILRKVGIKPKYHEGEKESEQALEYVREAIENLSGNFTPLTSANGSRKNTASK